MATPVPQNQSGIYAITNILNGKQYIGSAVNLRERWTQHRTRLTKHTHHSRHLQAAWDKYGADAFQFSVLEYVADIAQLIEREQYYMDVRFAAKSSIEYNSRPRAESNLGWQASEATRQLMSAKLKGRIITWRDKLIGRAFSAEHRKHISDKAKARRWPAAHKTRISDTLKGRPKSKPKSAQQREASRRNILATHTPEARAKATETRQSHPPTATQLAYWARLGVEVAERNRQRAGISTDASQLHTPEVRAKALRTRQQHRDAFRAALTPDATKCCRRCGVDKPLVMFFINTKAWDGRQAYCKDCARKYKQEH